MGLVDTTIKLMAVWIHTQPALGNWSFLVCQNFVISVLSGNIIFGPVKKMEVIMLRIKRTVPKSEFEYR